MIETLDMSRVAFDTGYQPPPVMAESESTSAFDVDRSANFGRRPDFRRLFADNQNAAVTLTTDLNFGAFFSDAVVQELGDKSKRTKANLLAFQIRIATLRSYAMQEGYDLSLGSKRDFWRFIRMEPFVRKGSLVLLENGNLRAVWKDDLGTHFGLQFLGGGTVQYVIFKQRVSTGVISRVSGRDSFEGMNRQIAAFDLRPLIFS